ncbi:Metabotropic glutamate receptor 5 [Trichinella pseudospiralis]|uniref:Metabotropic glutamate receptor 5 n=1 Tax=Trichinella pseudospiralis TaxID=6337 RepID=A0A0V1ELZ2_TRIPS|nr:Metabotropic glutamate receptor 5 [Trichinella pseudospiralis]KRZ39752.1 Metabotropic glutamate receptor 5 [Trichinella pseudospiralis]
MPMVVVSVWLAVSLTAVLAPKSASHTRVARIPGDVEIGALFPIHRKIAGTERCGEIWEQYGIQRTEIALKTVDAINDDNALLANLKLGISVRDDCWTERIAMEQTIIMVRDAVGGPNAHSKQQRCCCCPEDKHCQANDGDDPTSNLVAVIGPGSSDVSIAVQNLLQVFHIPQVGYSATTKALSDKTEFKYYMRMVPSDSWQAKAIVDIVKYFHWSYVAVVYTDGNYGEKGFEELQKNFDKEDNLCIGVAEKIKSLAPAADYDALIRLLMTHRPQITVAICFCEGDTIKRIFQATKRVRESLQPDGNDTYQGLQWIGSESWSDRKDVVAGVEDVAAGGFSFRIYSPRMTQFDSYYFNLTPKNNYRNPWFVDFWEEKFQCSYTESTRNLYSKICTGNENVSYGYKPDPKLSQVTNAIYTVAYALDAMYNDLCKGSKEKGLCEAMTPVDGTVLFQYMLKTMFRDPSGQEIYFDANGDPPARYDILNYQGKVASYVTAGEWDHSFHSDKFSHQSGIYYKSKLRIDRDKILWHNHMSGLTYTPTARCSYDCKVGEIKKIQTLKCCWICVPCYENEYLLNEYACKSCPLGYWPLENRTACYKLEVEYMRWSDAEAVVCVVFACVGIIATLFTIIIFILHNSTPVVKATTRELSYIILVGLLLCYMTTFFIITPPNMVSCIIQRIVPGTAFSMIYGALFTKTNRIARILAASKKITTKRRRFLSISAQVTITGLLVLIELITIVVFLIFEPPKADFDYSLPKRVLLICRTSGLTFFAPFGFDLFLVGMCTLYAVKTRNLPENFNEAKFIGFTMYTTCVIWLAFIAIYFGSAKKDTTMCICFSLSATVALILLYFPKMYVILLRPEKNARSYFKTTTTIRCHFGSNAKSSSSDGGGGGSRISSVQGSQRKKRWAAVRHRTQILHSPAGRYVARSDSYSSYSAQSTPDPMARERRHSGRFAAGDEFSSRDEQQADESACKPEECSSDSQRLLRVIDEMPSVKEETDDDETAFSEQHPVSGRKFLDRTGSLWRRFDPFQQNPRLNRGWRSLRVPAGRNDGEAAPTLLLKIAAERLDTVRHFIDADAPSSAYNSGTTAASLAERQPPRSNVSTISGRASFARRKGTGHVWFSSSVGETDEEEEEEEDDHDDEYNNKMMDIDRRGTGERLLHSRKDRLVVCQNSQPESSGEKQTAFSNGGFPVIEFDEVDMRTVVLRRSTNKNATGEDPVPHRRPWARKVRSNSDTVAWLLQRQSQLSNLTWNLTRSESEQLLGPVRGNSLKTIFTRKSPFTKKQQTKSMPCLRFEATVNNADTAGKQQYSSPGSSLVTTALTGFSRTGSMSGSLLLSPIEELSSSSSSNGSAKSSNGSSPTSVIVSGYDFSTISLV